MIPIVQLESISAFVASGAAVLGVPAALIVGLRQARAARLAAELASEAARQQWHTSNRREAAVTFVVEAERQLEEARRIRNADVPLDLSEASAMRRDLLRALAIVRIEGPSPLSDLAAAVQKTVDGTTVRVMADHRRRRPMLVLRTAADEGNETARRAIQRINSPTRRGRTIDESVWRELRESGLLTRQELGRLARRTNGTAASAPREPFSFYSSYQQARSELGMFVETVRVHLDGTAAS